MSQIIKAWPIRTGGTNWLLAAGIAAVALAALALVDGQISHFGRSLPEPALKVFSWITRLGQADWILIPSLAVAAVAGLAMIAVRQYTARRALLELTRISGFIFLSVSATGLVTNIIKRLVGRGRPEVDGIGPFDFRSFSGADWAYESFPSGHATTAFAFCFTIAFLVPRAFPALLGLAVLVGVSRIVLGAHFPTDVMAGAVIGTLGAYFVRNVFATRRWVFERATDGTVVARPLIAIRRLFIPRRGSLPRRP